MIKQSKDRLKENMIFVGTIYDSFEALEETLGKLKLERPLFITHVAKMAFAEEVFKRADDKIKSCRFIPQKIPSQSSTKFYN
ncbi:MAG: hypothetical protein IJ864_03320 [Alphaproteobacteria bacterium]|nr:hypothetical protein [Alphaproteobacteria bacterium]